METATLILAGIALFAVLLSLFTGVILMAIGGEINKKYGNKAMQARVVLQGTAVALFMLAMVLS